MSRVYLSADHHFGHRNILKHENRPFDSIEEMDLALVTYWNEIVRPEDIVYYLGDISMSKKGLETAELLNGKITLIMGNHDWQKLGMYVNIFHNIRAYKELNGYLLSHIPVHPSQKPRYKGNIHGHTHSKRVNENSKIDPWYYSVSVEHTNYRPIIFEEVIKRMEKRE